MKKKCAKFAVPSCAFVCFAILFLFLPSHPVFKRSLDLIYLHAVLAARPIVTPGWGSSPVALLIPGLGIRAFQLANNCPLYAAANGNDANSGTSSDVDLALGAKVYAHATRNGRRQPPWPMPPV
jgi:hypothetical protein